jgi:serine/threonine protein kinase
MVDRYYNQCRSLSELRHPHIVHFLGICFFPDSLLPVLVTERLHSTLDDMLGQYTEIPLYVKLSVLHDVTKGLLFLHTRNPAVVHRALTARNVLLDATMTAKIADLDNSSLLPRQLALSYMPPETASMGKTDSFWLSKYYSSRYVVMSEYSQT